MTGVPVLATANLLFVHRSFPGQFLHLVRHLAVQGTHRVAFISEATTNRIPGIHQAGYAIGPVSARTPFDAHDFEEGIRRATAVAEVARGLHEAGFRPDLIVGHEGWGETLNLPDVWPGVPMLAYREYFYHLQGADVGCDPEFPVPIALQARIRAKNAIGLLGLQAGASGMTPTDWQRSLYPDWAQRRIAIVPDGVDLDICRPDAEARRNPFELSGIRVDPGEELVTFVARELEPYRGFHTFMRALPAILRERPRARVVCVGGDDVAYGIAPPRGTWREALSAEVAGELDATSVHFAGKLPYADHVRLLQRSDVHVYPSYPFILSWSAREAMACGCAIVAADTAPVREIVTSETTGLLFPMLDAARLANAVIGLLADESRRRTLGANAREYAVGHMSLTGHLRASLQSMQAALDA